MVKSKMNSSNESGSHPGFLLIDLPVFPKGVLSLGLPVLAAYLREHFVVKILDINQERWEDFSVNDYLHDIRFVGIKVSSQNYDHAIHVTQSIKASNPDITVLWGGELPSLLPEESSKHADIIVTRRIEGCIDELLKDLRQGKPKKKYEGSTNFHGKHVVPALDLQFKAGRYHSFMGVPLETSTGCDKFCRFCMVHTMQPGVKYKDFQHLSEELKQMNGKFLNVVDYNIGTSKDHLINVCREIQRSGVTGWMGELCLETLDDETILEALKKSRCKMIYCGLESLSEEGLKSVNKHKTNNPDNYRRIIRKAQSNGVNIASGFIIGLDGASEQTFNQMMDFYNEIGIEYVKFTFLTYNPGTYFYKAMKRSGSYTTEDITRFDGNHLTYLAEGLHEKDLYESSEKFIRKFYSLSGIVGRSGKAYDNWLRRIEFILFNICYRQAYLSWIRFGVLQSNSTGIRQLMNKPFSIPMHVRFSERLLEAVRLRLFLKQAI